MLGSLMSMAGYWLVLMVLVVWMCVRIWRSSPALAVVTFFFWPASVLALFSNWGDRDSDIRLPFAMALLTAGLVAFMAQRSVDKGIEEMALVLSQEEIELIRAEDPQLAIRLEEARADFIAEEALVGGDDIGGSQGGRARDAGSTADGDDRSDSVASTSGVRASAEAAGDVVGPPLDGAAMVRDPAEIAAEREHSLRVAAMALSWRFGTLALQDAGATIAIPQEFRFAPGHTLVRLAWLRKLPLDAGLAGWLVHRRVDLVNDDAWYVDVRFHPLGRLPALPDAAAGDDERALQRAAFVAELAYAIAGTRKLPLRPQWDAAHGVASWQRAGDGERRDAVAARVLPGGALVFTVSGLAPAHEELAMRSVRLMALRSTPLPPERVPVGDGDQRTTVAVASAR